jgi:hypothetical protein
MYKLHGFECLAKFARIIKMFIHSVDIVPRSHGAENKDRSYGDVLPVLKYVNYRILVFIKYTTTTPNKGSNLLFLCPEYMSRVKISHLVTSLPTSRQEVVFALHAPSCQQVWNKLLTDLLQDCFSKSDKVTI